MTMPCAVILPGGGKLFERSDILKYLVFIVLNSKRYHLGTMNFLPRIGEHVVYEDSNPRKVTDICYHLATGSQQTTMVDIHVE